MARLTDLRKNKLKEYIEDVNRICPVEAAYLFGSWAEGKAKKDSDFDIAIFSGKINSRNRHRYIKEFLRLIFKYPMDIQPLAYSLKDYHDTSNGFINDEIKNKGMLIFANNEFKI